MINVIAIVCISVLLLAVIPLDNESEAETNNQSVSISSSVNAYADNKGYNSDRLYSNCYKYSISSMELITESGIEKKGQYCGFDAYCVSGPVSFKMNISGNYSAGSTIYGKYQLSEDTWSGSVAGVPNAGEVKTGVLIVRTSSDGYSWNDPTKGIYENGWFNSDFIKTYNKSQTMQNEIYNTKGKAVGGTFYQVILAYEVYYGGGLFGWFKTYENVVESYKFFISYDDPESVAFHNLSLYGENETKY